MAHPIYYVPAGDVLPIFFDSFDGGTGASITMTGLAVTDIEIYKDGSVTQRASDAGYVLLDTDGIDFDGITGIHGFSIDTGDNTDAGFYTVGAWFTVVVSAITIDAQTVNFVAAQFRIMEAETTAGRPLVQTAALSANAITATAINADAITAAKIANGAIDAATFAADVDAEILSYIVDDATRIDASALNTAAVTSIPAILVDTAEIGAAGAGLTALATQASVNTIDDFLDTEIAAILADTNELQTDWANGGRLDLLIDAIKAKTDNLPSDPADQSLIIAATDAIIADTNDIQTRLPAALVSGRMDSSVGAMAAGTVTAAAIATDAVDADALAADAAAEIADKVLNRNINGGSDTGRRVFEALAFMRNKWTIVAGTLTVFDTDDTTPLFTAAITTTPGADPVTASDPA